LELERFRKTFVLFVGFEVVDGVTGLKIKVLS
jgi:hypothetical protein